MIKFTEAHQSCLRSQADIPRTTDESYLLWQKANMFTPSDKSSVHENTQRPIRQSSRLNLIDQPDKILNYLFSNTLIHTKQQNI